MLVETYFQSNNSFMKVSVVSTENISNWTNIYMAILLAAYCAIVYPLPTTSTFTERRLLHGAFATCTFIHIFLSHYLVIFTILLAVPYAEPLPFEWTLSAIITRIYSLKKRTIPVTAPLCEQERHHPRNINTTTSHHPEFTPRHLGPEKIP